MNTGRVVTAYLEGVSATQAVVEADISRAEKYYYSVVGLPDKTISESEDRITSALKNSSLPTPVYELERVTISLSPANARKEGSWFDVPIALAYLIAHGRIAQVSDNAWFVGELSLTGSLLPLDGILAISLAAKRCNISELFVPIENAQEAALVSGVTVFGVSSLLELVNHLEKKSLLHAQPAHTLHEEDDTVAHMDMAAVKGNVAAKRALAIAAAGGHNIALYGPPGTGKSMLAKAFTGILPSLTHEDAIAALVVSSVSGEKTAFHRRPHLRAPHHTSSFVSLVGGGTHPRPGEITKAHKGVLFLDELPLFDKKCLEALREPLEDKVVRISRARSTHTFPADITLIAALNPCPCGYYGSPTHTCVCDPMAIERYKHKISGPILDRIDMWIPVTSVSYELLGKENEQTARTSHVRALTTQARTRSRTRLTSLAIPGSKNSDITAEHIPKIMPRDPDTLATLEKMATVKQLSGRAYHRIIKVARTIADVKGEEEISKDSLMEAFQYRPKIYE